MSEVQSVESLYSGTSDEAGSTNPVAEPYLSVAEAARALRISPTTLRRYIQDYSAQVDAIRDSRKLMVAVSSIPALAQIRDLRARKFQKTDIDKILSALPGEISLSGLAGPADSVADQSGENSGGVAIDQALVALRTDFNKLKRESRDSEVVVRQSLANILFLIEKCSKEVQFHVSEERLASNERDLRIAEYEQEIQLLSDDRKQGSGWRTTLASLYHRILGGTISG